jgi:hypothetical protein
MKKDSKQVKVKKQTVNTYNDTHCYYNPPASREYKRKHRIREQKKSEANKSGRSPTEQLLKVFEPPDLSPMMMPIPAPLLITQVSQRTKQLFCKPTLRSRD